jgi:hypothetical protein
MHQQKCPRQTAAPGNTHKARTLDEPICESYVFVTESYLWDYLLLTSYVSSTIGAFVIYIEVQFSNQEEVQLQT